MNQTRVDNGHATEAAVFRALGARGVCLIDNERRQRCTYALDNLTDHALRDRIIKQSAWLVDRLLTKEQPSRAAMTGEDGRFADIVLDDRLTLSVKHNSKEIGGQRLSRNSVHRLPLPGTPATSDVFKSEIEPAFIALDTWQPGVKAEPWQRAFLHNTIGMAIVEELNRNPPVFRDVIPPHDHYLLTCGTKGPRIEGFNFHGSLNCSKVKLPLGRPSIRHQFRETRAQGVRCLYWILIDYDGGWSIRLRLHTKGKIGPSCFGGSTTIEGTPGGFYRLEP